MFSDLIEFATDRDLYLKYSKCLEFLNVYDGDNTYVQLASIEYVLKNLRFELIQNIYDFLYSVLNNPECNQSNQVMSAFALLRITGNSKFLADLIDLVVNGDSDNKELLNNLLSLDCNNEKYFEHSKVLNSLLYQKD